MLPARLAQANGQLTGLSCHSYAESWSGCSEMNRMNGPSRNARARIFWLRRTL
jgi:hypothetical protein